MGLLLGDHRVLLAGLKVLRDHQVLLDLYQDHHRRVVGWGKVAIPRILLGHSLLGAAVVEMMFLPGLMSASWPVQMPQCQQSYEPSHQSKQRHQSHGGYLVQPRIQRRSEGFRD